MNYQDILKQAGYPTKYLVVDFETYFDTEYSLKELSNIEYAKDERFEVLGIGTFTKQHGSKFWPADILNYDFNDYTVVVKNAKFDVLILQEHYNVVPPYIIDVEDLTRHYDSRMKHSLEKLAKAFLKGEEKGDTMKFKGLHRSDMTEEQLNDLAVYCNQDTKLEAALFEMFLPRLTNPVFELWLQRHTLNLYLNPAFEFDYALAGRIRNQMRAKLEKAAEATGHTVDEISGNKTFKKLLKEALPEGEEIPMKVGKKGMIPALAKDDDGKKYLLNHPDPKVRGLMEARQAVKSWPLHIKRVENIFNQARHWESGLGNPLKYYGGHTGRWSGTEGINTQNFGGMGRGTAIDPLISKMRNMLIAPDGNTLAIADSAQIEARVLAWLAEECSLLNGFTKGDDVYSKFATVLFGLPIRKPKDNDPEGIAKFLKIRRSFGKDAILGSGYGMGSEKFHARCLANPDLRPLFESGEYTKVFIKKLIDTYRSTYKQIPAYWGKVEKAFRWVVKYPDKTADVGPIHFSCKDGTASITLPSSRCLFYRHCSVDHKGNVQYHWGDLWGGSITENIVQAVARDLLAWWIFEIEKCGIRVIHHAHDEVVCLAPRAKADEVLEEVLCVLNRGPKWAAGLPLAAEGELSDVYKK